jgi:hypothetical protein
MMEQIMSMWSRRAVASRPAPRRTNLGLTLQVLLSCALLGVAGCKSAIVGSECRPGFTLCGAECVNLQADFRNCGECGSHCGRFICDEGSCTRRVRPDAGPPDAGDNEASVPDAAAPDASREAGPPEDGGFDPDAGLGGCLVGRQECEGSCVDPEKDRAHCGICGNACGTGELCSGGVCAPQCEDPLVACDDQCVVLSSDPEHCGSCGGRCASGICEAAVCADAIAGQVVVIGHDFTTANNAMRRIAGNAVFLARGAPVRVLVYRGDANAASVSGVEQAIDFAKAEIGRDWRKVDAIEALVPLQLADADVLLVHAQANATNSTLQKLGQQWGSALGQFLVRGGIVVLIEAPTTRNDGTYRILVPSNIFAAASRSSIAVQQLRVQTPGLGVALRVPDRYMSAENTVRFDGVSTAGTSIVVDGTMRPVVVQRVIVP